MDPTPLRDCLSVTGVDGPGRAMAVGAQGQLVFKKSATELCYYDVQELSVTILTLSKRDPLYDDCYFYDLSFLRGGTLAVCLQRPTTGELFICEGTIDSQEKTVDVGGCVYPTKIRAAKGRNVSLLNDEAGVVLISYPIKWNGKDFIELFHVSNFLSAGSGDKYVISLSTKDKVDATFGNVFISRNYLYMFYAHDYAKFLLVSLAGNNCGKCQIRTSQGLPPSENYMGKSVLVFEDFALVYAYMNIRPTFKPNLYMLNLTNLKWIPLNLSLSHHFPTGKISVQKLGEELIYIHGDCNVVNCSEKAHLYQINVESLGSLVSSRSRSHSLGVAHGCLQFPSVSSVCMSERRSNSLSATCRASQETPPTTPTTDCPMPIYKSDAPVARYKKKQSKEEMGRRRFSTHLVGKASSGSVDGNDCGVKRSPSCSSLHWGADMAEQCGKSLQEQIKLAHEMGYGEDVVIAALNLQQGHSDKPYQPFGSTNAMLDCLNHPSLRQKPPPTQMTLSLYDGSANCSDRDRAPRASSVSRSSSFHLGSPRTTRSENHDLFRLIRALDKEKERDKKEVDQQFTRLKTRIHDLERERDSQRAEIERLLADNEEKERELSEKTEKLGRLMDEVNTLKETIDKETIKNLHLAKDLDNQKELTEHRRKKYEDEQSAWQQKEATLQEEIRKISAELERKSALLDEQTDISRRLEQRSIIHQSGALLEQIRKHQEEAARSQAQAAQLMEHFQTRIPEMEAEQRRLEVALEDSQRRGREEAEALRREISGLLEKTTAECCICLSTKPNVVFLPCRHLAICHGCEEDSGQLSDCPACRTKIDSTLQIYT